MKGFLEKTIDSAELSTKEYDREISVNPCQHVTFATINKIKFCRDYNNGTYSDNLPLFLEIEAFLTIAELKTTSHFHNGMIKTITSDINSSERMIYFEITLSPKITPMTLVEILSCINNLL